MSLQGLPLLRACLLASAAALVLAACGGGDGHAAAVNATADTVPLSAVASTAAYQGYVADLGAAPSADTAEPVSMGGPWDAPQSDTTEPLTL